MVPASRRLNALAESGRGDKHIPALRGGSILLNIWRFFMIDLFSQLLPLCSTTKKYSGSTTHRKFQNPILWRNAVTKFSSFYNFTLFEVETDRSEEVPHDLAYCDGFALGFLRVYWEHYSGKPMPFEEHYNGIIRTVKEKRAIQAIALPNLSLDDLTYTSSTRCKVENKEVHLFVIVQFSKGKTRFTLVMVSNDNGQRVAEIIAPLTGRRLN